MYRRSLLCWDGSGACIPDSLIWTIPLSFGIPSSFSFWNLTTPKRISSLNLLMPCAWLCSCTCGALCLRNKLLVKFCKFIRNTPFWREVRIWMSWLHLLGRFVNSWESKAKILKLPNLIGLSSHKNSKLYILWIRKLRKNQHKQLLK